MVLNRLVECSWKGARRQVAAQPREYSSAPPWGTVPGMVTGRAQTERRLRLAAFAKVNLALEVTARRADGFHNLDTVFLVIDWADTVTVELTTDPGQVVVTVEGSAATAGMAAGDALLARAARGALAGTGAGARIHLVKDIPVGAGLGGGSADAAAVLRAVARLTGRDVDPDLAERLGSDVPALVLGGASRGRGRGELLSPLPVPPLHLAVAVAGVAATAAVYAACEPDDLRSDGRAAAVARALETGHTPPDELLGSALEAPARRACPALAAGLDRLRATTPGTRWHLTGSGGAAFSLAATAAAASTLVAAVRAAGLAARACVPAG